MLCEYGGRWNMEVEVELLASTETAKLPLNYVCAR